MVIFDIHTSKTALLVIDMQNFFLKPGAPLETPTGRDQIPRLNKLIRACHGTGIPVIFTCQAFRADGSDMGLVVEFSPELYRTKSALIEGTPDVDISAEIERQEGDIIITKHTYSAFVGTELDPLLRIKGIDTLIIGGVTTAFCCEATARDARHRNYKVLFLSDGTAPADLPDMGWGVIPADEVQRMVLTVMANRYAEVLSVKEVLKRIQPKRVMCH